MERFTQTESVPTKDKTKLRRGIEPIALIASPWEPDAKNGETNNGVIGCSLLGYSQRHRPRNCEPMFQVANHAQCQRPGHTETT
ncbi:unnamed protein product [Penicillium roqueforti FM164]|uniref:Genomic scaffold, ProqFM164S02 n=1 Tax=Penicillium roqueforti (strain FM164) TaxID=1365484 RepID=W6Q8I5_PENRF|nr:unnamed protein product [Penicillium roqueforti FM164]